MCSREFVLNRLGELSQAPLPEIWGRLKHRLSDYIQSPGVSIKDAVDQEDREAAIYRQWLATVPSRLEFRDIQKLNSLSGAGGKLREGSTYLVSQDMSVAIPMVNWAAARERLTEVPGLIETGALGRGLLAAIRVLALVVNAHAFTDGNGRLGRFLFNFCLHRSGLPPRAYVPLKVVAALCSGGFEIRLREVSVFNRWDGFLEYHCLLVRLVCELATEGHQVDGSMREQTDVQ
jgi:hypothetical protein